ncbi:hypothetical protein GCM10010428_72300 [Actinosynnema pretiosum subsp. pretiosum]
MEEDGRAHCGGQGVGGAQEDQDCQEAEVGEAVGHGVDDCAEGADLAGAQGYGAVEAVEEAGGDDEEEGEEGPAVVRCGCWEGGGCGEDACGGEDVRGDSVEVGG